MRRLLHNVPGLGIYILRPPPIINTSLPRLQTPLPQQIASANCMPERKTKQSRLEEKYLLVASTFCPHSASSQF